MPKFEVTFRRPEAVGVETIEADTAEDAEEEVLENLEHYLSFELQDSTYVNAIETTDLMREEY